MSDWPYPYARWFSGERDPLSLADLLLRAGANPNSTHFKIGKNSFSIAISRRDYLPVRLPIDAAANPNLANQNGTTAVNIARQQEFSEILKLIQQ